METNINNENMVNDEAGNNPEQAAPLPENEIVSEPTGKKKYHSSAMYAASMWHNTVKHVKPPHPRGGFITSQD